LGGFLIGAGSPSIDILRSGGIGVLGLLLTLLVPVAGSPRDLHSTLIEPTRGLNGARSRCSFTKV
jgi:hypothetical protein